MGAVARHHQVTVGGNDGARRDDKTDPVHETPIAHVHRVGAAVVKFEILILRQTGKRMIHDLVDDDVVLEGRAVGRPGRRHR